MSFERASVFETTQIGPESTPGTQVAALKRLLCTSFNFTPNIPIAPYTPQGSKAPTTATKNKGWTTGDVNGRICFNDIAYLLSGVLCVPVISTPTNGVLTRRWVWQPQNWGPDTVKTFTVEKGSKLTRAERAIYTLINSLTMRFAREEASVTGAIYGRDLDYAASMSTNEVQTLDLGGATGGTFTVTFNAVATAALAFNVSAANLQTALEGLSTVGAGNVLVEVVSAGVYRVTFRRGLGQSNVAALTIGAGSLTGGGATTVTTVTPGVAPTDIPAVVADVDQVSVYAGPDKDTLSRLRRVDSIEFGVTDRFNGVFDLQDDFSSFAAHVERAPGLAANLVMQRNDDYADLITFLKARTTRVMKVEVLGPLIESVTPDYRHRLSIYWPHKFMGPTSGSAEDVETGGLNLFPVYDSGFFTTGGFVRVELDTMLTAL